MAACLWRALHLAYIQLLHSYLLKVQWQSPTRLVHISVQMPVTAASESRQVWLSLHLTVMHATGMPASRGTAMHAPMCKHLRCMQLIQ